MRKVENSQMEFGEIAIGEIHIEAKSRDDIPAVLKGIQHIYIDSQIHRRIFAFLTEQVRPGINLKVGWQPLGWGLMSRHFGSDEVWKSTETE